ncbi:class I SAM-dependent methyltransferase [Puia dinghuensis]|uniref:Methyltransferase type 11 domain-containing protein n=1 Tax=Puia dinghuensis TaxID=1792502 RepID=A0A8J2UH53_9BACT|nr:class I SAM-dependent methyltransferase [Puia dinghuensis]GGB14741.1 hypothetical protein GCM10011511_43140 [Puia dinghuensis]
MKARLKSLLQKLGIYYPLQTAYRGGRSFIAKQYYRVGYGRYKGRGYTCNYCGATYGRFVPEYPGSAIAGAINDNHVIAGFGENVYCPQCLSKNRERLVKAVIGKYVVLGEAARVLHFSPEKHLHRWLRGQTAVTSVDIAPRFYTSIDKQIRYADATQLSFGANSFELVIANHILEHIPDDAKAMREIHRVLAGGGVAILQVPYSTTLATTIEDPGIDDPRRQAALYGQRDHVRIYSFADYVRRLETAGFKVRVLSPEDLAVFRGHAIQEKESVFLCYKG